MMQNFWSEFGEKKDPFCIHNFSQMKILDPSWILKYLYEVVYFKVISKRHSDIPHGSKSPAPIR